MASITDYDFSELGLWPNDCFDQQVYIETLQNKLNEVSEFVTENSSQVVMLSQASEPTQGQWETAWVLQTGGSLPIPSTAVLIWYDSANAVIGGQYGTMPGFVTVSRRIGESVKGTVVYLNTQHDAVARSSTRSLFDNPTILPSISFTTYVLCSVIFELEFTCTAGATNAGADFLFDNVKLGTQYYGIQPNGGIIEAFPAARQLVNFTLTDVLPGAHVAKPLLGVAGAPATPVAVGWGGVGNVLSFTVRVVVQ